MNAELKTRSYAAQAPNITQNLAYAERIIKQRGERFTAIRKYIYQVLLEASHPLGAYEIIDLLEGVGAQKPPTVYRALGWLIERGLAAKIECNSRYTAMPIGLEADNLVFVICRACGETDAVEAPSLTESLRKTAKDRGFAETQMVVEIIGLCREHTVEAK